MRATLESRTNTVDIQPTMPEASVNFGTRGKLAIGLAAAVTGFGAYELAQSSDASAATQKSEIASFKADKCSHQQIQTINGLLSAWKKNRIDDDVANKLGLKDIDGETLEQRAKHFAKAIVAVDKVVKDYGCGFADNFGKLIDVGGKKVKAGSTPIIDTLSLEAKYPDGYSLKSKEGYKKKVVVVDAIALDTCANPITGKLMVFVWVKQEQKSVVIKPQTPTPKRETVITSYSAHSEKSKISVVEKTCPDGSKISGRASAFAVANATGRSQVEANRNAAKKASSILNEKLAKVKTSVGAEVLARCAVKKPVTKPKTPAKPQTPAPTTAMFGLSIEKKVYGVNSDGSPNYADDRSAAYANINMRYGVYTADSKEGKFVLACQSWVNAKIGGIVSLYCDGNKLIVADKKFVEICEDVATANNLATDPVVKDGCYIAQINGKDIVITVENKSRRSGNASTTPTPSTPPTTPAPKTNVPAPVGAPGGTTAPGVPKTSNPAITDPK